MKKILIVALLLATYNFVLAQEQEASSPAYKAKIIYLDASVATDGTDFIGSLAYGHTWGLGKRKQFLLGTGLRYSGFAGQDKNYVSAPPEFYGNEEKQDTVFMSSPSQSNIAIYISASYLIKNKIELGFNIDAIGYTFGAEQSGVYTGNGQPAITTVSPNNVSALLVGANDIGMLKAEFYGAYRFDQNWAGRIGLSNAFTEFSTPTELQKGNTRYRGTSNLFFLSARYTF